jgi:hypothetical protein
MFTSEIMQGPNVDSFSISILGESSVHGVPVLQATAAKTGICEEK